ncbi:Dihydrofolate reductase [Corynebacterium pseudotuberculosis 267]|uniref:dihydrofolate reductase n=1 Tax=Corynebacterium pseudotuberculosis TaxID=1719 RepID=UPI0002593AF0|nr:dihydrofolate reductase [Corynebacterium pseudotuberculosis]AFH51563.1 Dihydrofolate reductase [Corynebacterium pseudotuberculosis 267]
MLRAIWAQSRDGVIGNGSDMPWHLPEDLAHFKKTTLGCPVIMGRKTWESLPPTFRPLPGRQNYVLSRSAAGPWSTGACVVSTLPDVTGAWIMGGGQIYDATLPKVKEVVRTAVDVELLHVLGESAVSAPALGSEFEIVSETEWMASISGKLHREYQDSASSQPLRYKFQSLRRTA